MALVSSTPDWAVQVKRGPGTLCCVHGQYMLLSQCLSLPRHTNGIPTSLILGVEPAMDYLPIQGGVEILLVASCYRNRDKLWPDEPIGLFADFTPLTYLR